MLPVLLLLFCLRTGFGASPEKSVVQITVFSQQPVWDAPWRFDSVRRSSGTGFVIKGRRIMTNGHVVSWGRQILIRRYQDPRPYAAKVLYAAHDCDLAILEVEDPNFFEGMEALEIGELPEVRSTVVTYGYPAGGEQISYTRGVVSRIELQSYSHIGNRAYLAAQTDAAINPGNSGGPVIQEDKVVGVAFQGIPGLENTGFFIPTTLVNHFLKDVEDGKYDGFPQAGLRLVALQNPAYRKNLQLPDNDLGARIDHIYPVPSSRELLKVDDVLLKVGPYDVGSDGTIVYRGNRVFLSVAFSDIQNGESVPVTLWRDGKQAEVMLPLYTYTEDKREGNQYDVLPRYYVYGGLVFVPLTRDYMKTFGAGWTDSANADLIYELFYRRHESPATTRKEPVVLASVLAHAANANFEIRGRALVDKINGMRIESLDDVIRACEDPGERKHDVIEFYPDKTIETLSRPEARAAHSEILTTYGISKDRRL
ncbi:MAG: trypsin-like peptidase domain-containing protein [Verrucomicrobiota bacterium]|nr:trypsin-like peptidase domain-containing protein [Verrucomicrobiota bacterium]